MAIKGITPTSIDFEKLTQDLKRASAEVSGKEDKSTSAGKSEFLDLLEKGIKEVNTSALEAEKSSMDLASGKSSNIHETMLAVTKAELGFNMMVQMRNKVIEAYQEVMRMQV
ncbi:MAG: flagellar hook-basal body complex protein FliE [Bdellovibrionota bacterium]